MWDSHAEVTRRCRQADRLSNIGQQIVGCRGIAHDTIIGQRVRRGINQPRIHEDPTGPLRVESVLLRCRAYGMEGPPLNLLSKHPVARSDGQRLARVQTHQVSHRIIGGVIRLVREPLIKVPEQRMRAAPHKSCGEGGLEAIKEGEDALLSPR